jgi:hypothetical protein
MAASTNVPGPNFKGIMRHAELRSNLSGSAPNKASMERGKITGNSIKIQGGSAKTASPTKSVTTPSQPSAGAVRGNVGKAGVKLPGYDTTPPPKTPRGYAAYRGKAGR